MYKYWNIEQRLVQLSHKSGKGVTVTVLEINHFYFLVLSIPVYNMIFLIYVISLKAYRLFNSWVYLPQAVWQQNVCLFEPWLFFWEIIVNMTLKNKPTLKICSVAGETLSHSFTFSFFFGVKKMDSKGSAGRSKVWRVGVVLILFKELHPVWRSRLVCRTGGGVGGGGVVLLCHR